MIDTLRQFAAMLIWSPEKRTERKRKKDFISFILRFLLNLKNDYDFCRNKKKRLFNIDNQIFLHLFFNLSINDKEYLVYKYFDGIKSFRTRPQAVWAFLKLSWKSCVLAIIRYFSTDICHKPKSSSFIIFESVFLYNINLVSNWYLAWFIFINVMFETVAYVIDICILLRIRKNSTSAILSIFQVNFL